MGFSEKLGVSLDTLKSWELERRHPQDAYVDMLIIINEDPMLEADLKKLYSHYSKVEEVLCYIESRSCDEIDGLRFVFHGKSGCGKTTVVNELDRILPIGEGVAENTDLYITGNFCKALEIINDEELAYENSKHIVFNVMSDDLAASLESNDVKVFHFN